MAGRPRLPVGLIEAEACVLTVNAVRIRFTVAGKELKTWMWASARA
jgi:hypothetical protein